MQTDKLYLLALVKNYDQLNILYKYNGCGVL